MADKPKNILVIGDLHAPFTLEGYLPFCQNVYKQYKCDHVVFIGDIIDNHYSSYHETDPDGYGAGEELKRAIDVLSKWHKAFPNADCILGNHDRMVARKVFSAGVSTHWVRSLNEVLNVPTWTFHTKVFIDDVLYIHGEGVTARTKSMKAGVSVVQGHRHTEGYVWYQPTETKTLFGMQVGTGIDTSSYAFAYAKDSPPTVLSCGVVRGGLEAQIIPMI